MMTLQEMLDIDLVYKSAKLDDEFSRRARARITGGAGFLGYYLVQICSSLEQGQENW